MKNLTSLNCGFSRGGCWVLLWLLLLGLLPLPVCARPAIHVALFIGRGASNTAKRNFKRELSNRDDINYECITGEDIRGGVLNNFDALVVPGGSANKEALSMGPEAREEVRRFVKEGGIYMGVCAGAYLCSQAKGLYLGLLPVTTLDEKHWYRVDEGTPVDVELTPTGMEVLGVSRSNIRIVYENGPIFAPPDDKANITTLGFYRSEAVAPGGERGVMLGAPALMLSRYGRGLVLAISPHPEKTVGLKQTEVHALRWLYNHRAEQRNEEQNIPEQH